MPTAGWVELMAGLLGLRRRVRVCGTSMAPTLCDGDEVLVDPRAEPRVGDVVVSRHPYRTDVTWVKRLESVDEAGRLRLVGDNRDSLGSTDSRTQGAVPRELIIGRVTSRLP